MSLQQNLTTPELMVALQDIRELAMHAIVEAEDLRLLADQG